MGSESHPFIPHDIVKASLRFGLGKPLPRSGDISEIITRRGVFVRTPGRYRARAVVPYMAATYPTRRRIVRIQPRMTKSEVLRLSDAMRKRVLAEHEAMQGNALSFYGPDLYPTN